MEGRALAVMERTGADGGTEADASATGAGDVEELGDEIVRLAAHLQAAPRCYEELVAEHDRRRALEAGARRGGGSRSSSTAPRTRARDGDRVREPGRPPLHWLRVTGVPSRCRGGPRRPAHDGTSVYTRRYRAPEIERHSRTSPFSIATMGSRRRSATSASRVTSPPPGRWRTARRRCS